MQRPLRQPGAWRIAPAAIRPDGHTNLIKQVLDCMQANLSQSGATGRAWTAVPSWEAGSLRAPTGTDIMPMKLPVQSLPAVAAFAMRPQGDGLRHSTNFIFRY